MSRAVTPLTTTGPRALHVRVLARAGWAPVSSQQAVGTGRVAWCPSATRSSGEVSLEGRAGEVDVLVDKVSGDAAAQR